MHCQECNSKHCAERQIYRVHFRKAVPGVVDMACPTTDVRVQLIMEWNARPDDGQSRVPQSEAIDACKLHSHSPTTPLRARAARHFKYGTLDLQLENCARPEIKQTRSHVHSGTESNGATETKVRPLNPLLNCTVPSIFENIVWSLPIPVPSPGQNLLPRWRSRMLPGLTSCPPNFFTPRRRPAESRPFLDEPPAFLCAISLVSCVLVHC